MANYTEYSRLVMKRSTFAGEIPTVNTGDTIDNTWLTTDILPGELYYNLPDKKLYTRTGPDIILIGEGSTNLTGGTTPTLAQVLAVGNTGTTTIQYAADYSGSYNNRSLVDKEYVDNKVIDGVTASNGLTEVGTDIQLGGTLTSNTTLNTSTYNIDINNGTSSFLYTGIAGKGGERSVGIGVDGDPFDGDPQIAAKNKVDFSYLAASGEVLIQQDNGVDSAHIKLENEQGYAYADNGFSINSPNTTILIDDHSVITSTFPTFSGLTYAADYSSNFVNRSLVDKEYVDGLITGSGNTLSQVLALGNTTGDNWIDVSESGTGYGLYSGTYGSDFNLINFRNDRLLLYSWNGVDPKSQVTLWRDGNVDIQGNNTLGLSGGNGVILQSNAGNIDFDVFSAITVNSPSSTFRGIEYDDDYSSNYTNRSLVDKEYVDSVTSGGTTGGGSANQITYWSGSNTITGSSKLTYLESPTDVFTGLNFDNNNYQQSYIAAGTNQFVMLGEGNTNRIRLQSYNNQPTASANFDFVKLRGTNASPARIENGDEIGEISFIGSYTGSSVTTGLEMTVRASENWDTNNVGTEFIITKHNNGDSYSSILGTVFKIDGDGNSSFGNNRVSTSGQFKAGDNPTGVISSNSFNYNCDAGMTQLLDMNAATSASTITFSNQLLGNTYTLIVRQRAGGYNLVFPTGWWLNDTAPFDFTTLATDERAMVTMTYLDYEWYFGVKKLTYV